MQLEKIIKFLEIEPLQTEIKETEVQGGYTSDLLSDVMAHAKTGDILITIQAHKNTVAVAGLVGILAIIIANKRPVPEDMLAAAKEEKIGVFRSSCNQFELSGKLYQLLYADRLR
ncbi:MAG: hypothetical protein SNJ78_04875 [Spirochaetales bacterium]